MNKNDTIKFRIDGSLKRRFKEVCENNGRTMSEVLEVLIKKEILEISSK